MKEAINTKIDTDFEEQKKKTEWNNHQENRKYLASKFSEIISENPIVIYTQHNGDPKPTNQDISFNKVKDVQVDESGTGGGNGVTFDHSDYITVGKSGINASNFFDKKNDYYKIDEKSFHNILDMMSESIKASGYSEVEKDKMFQDVINNFKNKIIKKEDLEKITK